MISLLDVGFMLASLSVYFFLKHLFAVYRKPIFHLYQQPSTFYWLKVWIIYLLIRFKQLIGVGEKSEEELDRLQQLSHHEKAVDAVYFSGGNSTQDSFTMAAARRKYGLVDGFFYLKLTEADLGVLASARLPDTSLHQENDAVEEFAAEGIQITALEPMRKWRLAYQGQMKSVKNPAKVYEVNVDAEFTSELPYFNFHTDINAWSMAKAIALEKWSTEYFHNLKKFHQVHYEQHGDVKGTATIDGTSYPIAINAVRDHSFGDIRDWKHIHRYALHFITTEEGDRISIGAICMPVLVSNLFTGCVYSAQDKQNHSINSCDLKLYQHGEMGDPPVDYAFSFIAGGRHYCVQVKIIDKPSFYISKEWESKVYEMTANFKVNGAKGWGISEWAYRNMAGRNVIL